MPDSKPILLSNRPSRGRRHPAMRSVGWGLVLFCLCSGITTIDRAKALRESEKAWLDVRPLVMFELGSDTLPASADDLAISVSQGLKSTMSTPAGAVPVAISGGSYPTFDSISVDLSGAQLVDQSAKLNDNVAPLDGIFARRFTYTANPLLLGNAPVEYDLWAENAKFDVLRDEHGKPALVLADATEGSFHLHAPVASLQSFVTVQTHRLARKYGFLIKGVTVSFQSTSLRSIGVNFHITMILGSVDVSGRMDIDDDMIGTASHLQSIGHGPVGIIVSHFVGSAVQDYEGRSRTLVEFPVHQLRLRDIQVSVDQSVHITASFGHAGQ